MIDFSQPEKLVIPRIRGFEITKVWDADPAKARGFAQTLYDKPQVCDDIESIAQDVDAAFICSGSGNGEDHLEQATPFLKKGIPTFVDKPFAPNVRDARHMIKLATKHHAPIFSASILGHVNEITHLRRRLPETHGPIMLGSVKGVGGLKKGKLNLGAIIHGLALAQGVFGAGVEAVECIGQLPLEYVLLYYHNGVQVMVMNTIHSAYEQFLCDVFARCPRNNPPVLSHLRSNPMGNKEFLDGAYNILRLFTKMIKTRKPPVPYETMLELIATVQAAQLAQNQRRRVSLKEVLE